MDFNLKFNFEQIILIRMKICCVANQKKKKNMPQKNLFNFACRLFNSSTNCLFVIVVKAMFNTVAHHALV